MWSSGQTKCGQTATKWRAKGKRAAQRSDPLNRVAVKGDTPKKTKKMTKSKIKGVEHLSLYMLLVDWGTPAYDQIIQLRTEVLRIPLGLTFKTEELQQEYKDVHFACYSERSLELLGCLKLSVDPEKARVARMKQAAVNPKFQHMGVGHFMVNFFEQYCQSADFEKIELIKAKKVKLEGFKVVGKIDLPEKQKKEVAESVDNPDAKIAEKSSKKTSKFARM